MTAATKFVPEDWAEMKAGVFAWARAELDPSVAVAWSNQDAPSPPRPFVLLSKVSGPIADGHPSSTNRPAIQVKTAVADTDYTVMINAVGYTFHSSADPDPADYEEGGIHEGEDLPPTLTTAERKLEIRDGLIDLINAGYPIQVAAAADAATLMWLGADDTAIVVSDPNLRLKVAQMELGDAFCTFGVDAVVDVPDGSSEAAEAIQLAALLAMSLESAPARETLHAAGWAFIQVTGQRQPKQLAGSRWEDRAGFDVRLYCRTRHMNVIDFIEGTEEPITGDLT